MKPELRRTAVLVVLPLALAACGKSDQSAKATAAGEVLPGSASDAMLPLDTLRSQPPLAPPVEASSQARERKPEAAADAAPSDAASAAAADTAPADAESSSVVPLAE